jgi:hypothetical protein
MPFRFHTHVIENKNIRADITRMRVDLTRMHVAGAVDLRFMCFCAYVLMCLCPFLITPRYPIPGTEFLRIDFHRTNYGNHEPLPCCCALSFPTLNITERFYSPHQLIFVTRLSRSH